MSRGGRRRNAGAGGPGGAPDSLIHRNNCSNPVSMRVSGRFTSCDEAVKEAITAALAGDFDPDRIQLFSDPAPALAYAASTLTGRGILLSVFPIPDEVLEALEVPFQVSGLGAWAVGVPDRVLGAFFELVPQGGGDDRTRH